MVPMFLPPYPKGVVLLCGSFPFILSLLTSLVLEAVRLAKLDPPSLISYCLCGESGGSFDDELALSSRLPFANHPVVVV